MLGPWLGAVLSLKSLLEEAWPVLWHKPRDQQEAQTCVCIYLISWAEDSQK